ncbi:hypothetical protein TNCV_3911451 [Trichonephila clavipes]|nr:hypothetical protein TNCV_3911451 [Trichonephila clavipes]
MKPYHDPAEQIETEDIPPKESYKGPITRSRIKTLEQNDSGALSSFSREQCHTNNLLQVPIAELAERWTELPQVSVVLKTSRVEEVINAKSLGSQTSSRRCGGKIRRCGPRHLIMGQNYDVLYPTLPKPIL